MRYTIIQAGFPKKSYNTKDFALTTAKEMLRRSNLTDSLYATPVLIFDEDYLFAYR
jgi:hypothetical protein